MQKKSSKCKISDATKDEFLRGFDEIVQYEEHLGEIAMKTEDPARRKELLLEADVARGKRQELMAEMKDYLVD